MGHPLDARRHDAAAARYRDMRESDGIDASLRLRMPGGACAHAGVVWGEGAALGRVWRRRRRVSARRRHSASTARAGTAG